jgi:hypothetical protein
LVDGKHIPGFAGRCLCEKFAHGLAGVLGGGFHHFVVIFEVSGALGDILGAALSGTLLAGLALGLTAL